MGFPASMIACLRPPDTGGIERLEDVLRHLRGLDCGYEAGGVLVKDSAAQVFVLVKSQNLILISRTEAKHDVDLLSKVVSMLEAQGYRRVAPGGG